MFHCFPRQIRDQKQKLGLVPIWDAGTEGANFTQYTTTMTRTLASSEEDTALKDQGTSIDELQRLSVVKENVGVCWSLCRDLIAGVELSVNSSLEK